MRARSMMPPSGRSQGHGLDPHGGCTLGICLPMPGKASACAPTREERLLQGKKPSQRGMII
ncbi:hypothetical protein CDL15_Pgr007598 [Punica granatum]|uniref:Uncharacterized protein n=1 Tax=Punica granatum TaxID=22663 RepID=A0A218XA24_PUNGR|nr:hypothetical protein CDL15_Pgr007598 [Punica granatum]